jgi:dTDP-4-dehydrorhamnose reductase
MKVLVIGSSGQLARSLASTRRPGIEVTTVGRPVLDLRIPSTIERAVAAHRPDLIVNAAAYTAVDRAESEPEFAHAINARGAGLLASVSAAAGLPLIHVSTDYVFNGRSTRPNVEDDAVDPLNVYGSTKAEGEQRIVETNPQSIILRTSWLHSPFGRNFVSGMIDLATRKDEIAVVDDQFGSPTYGPHLATAILQIAEQSTRSGFSGWGIYHASGGGETTWCGLALEAMAVSKWLRGPSTEIRAITTAEYPLPAKRPRNSRLNCAKLIANFGVSLPNWRIGAALCVGEIIGRTKSTAAA